MAGKKTSKTPKKSASGKASKKAVPRKGVGKGAKKTAPKTGVKKATTKKKPAPRKKTAQKIRVPKKTPRIPKILKYPDFYKERVLVFNEQFSELFTGRQIELEILWNGMADLVKGRAPQLRLAGPEEGRKIRSLQAVLQYCLR